MKKLDLYIFLSVVPVVQLIGLAPLLSTNYGYSLSAIGGVFFLLRAAMLLGSYVSRFLILRFNLKVSISLAELLRLFTFIILIFCLFFNFIFGLVLSFITICFITGTLNNLRMTFLKGLENIHRSSKLAVYSSALVQSSYVISGVIFIFTSVNIVWFYYTIFFNLLSSLACLYLTWFDEEIFKAESIGKKKEFESYSGRGFIPAQLRLVFLSSMLIGVAFGGIDILCLKYGAEIYQKTYGFGVMTIIYSLGFYIGYRFFLRLKSRFTGGMIGGCLSLILCFLVLHEGYGVIVSSSLFLLIFSIYGVVYAYNEKEWFDNIDSSNANGLFFRKDLVISFVYALGEIVYGYLGDHGFYLRVCSLVILFFVFGVTFFKEQSLFKKEGL